MSPYYLCTNQAPNWVPFPLCANHAMHVFLLNMLVSKEFYDHYVHLPKNEVPPEILNNPKFFPFFKDCRGALDGSLLHAFVGKLALARYHCQKGFIATNLFATCLFCCEEATWPTHRIRPAHFWSKRQASTYTPPNLDAVQAYTHGKQACEQRISTFTQTQNGHNMHEGC